MNRKEEREERRKKAELAIECSRVGEEIWVTVPGSDKKYQVSNLGKVAKYSGGPWRMLKKSLVDGYYHVYCSRLFVRVHRLVLSSFVGACPPNKDVCAHGDGNSLNNCLYNLRWATAMENAHDAVSLRNDLSRYVTTKLLQADIEYFEKVFKIFSQAADIRLRHPWHIIRMLKDGIAANYQIPQYTAEFIQTLAAVRLEKEREKVIKNMSPTKKDNKQ